MRLQQENPHHITLVYESILTFSSTACLLEKV